MIRTQIQLTEAQYEELKERARMLDCSMAEVIRESVELYLSRSGEPLLGEKTERALSVVGRFASDLGDLSERHDDYLDEAFSQ